MRLLVAEDAADLAETLLRALRAEGHDVTHAATALEARAWLDAGGFDCVVLDLGLPDGSGMMLLRGMRRAGDRTPVIIATARDLISDRIAGLDAGANDYVVKPYDLRELSARIRAQARAAKGAAQDHGGPVDLGGGLRVDREAARVWRDGAEVRLTAREWTVLEALLAARGRVMPKAALEEALIAFDAEIEGNAVEVYVSRLRAKLGAGLIETRRGLGYMLP
ncbi:MAG: response regulator transcription factor [Pararhodobacter sp.]